MVKRMVTAALTITTGVVAGVLLAVAGYDGEAAAIAPSSHENTFDMVSSAQPSADAQPQSSQSAEQLSEGYYIKDFQGRVAVLRDGSDVPEMIFDIQTKMLPELDRNQLIEGIFVSSYEEMLRQVEDYIS